MAIKSKWVTWQELEPYREQLVDMEYELMVKYHYPDRIIPRTYPEKRVANLERALESGNTFLWISTEGSLLLGYYWAYISSLLTREGGISDPLCFLTVLKVLVWELSR